MSRVEEQGPHAAWPPGTVRLEALLYNKKEDIILQPHPTDDPNDPLNWPQWLKHWNFILVSFYSLLVFSFINMSTPTWAAMHEQLGFSYAILNDNYAAGTAALSVGAFIFIPFPLKYGRRPVYILSILLQFALSVWSAKTQTVADLFLVHILRCLLAAIAEVIIQMTVADMYFVHQRGAMNTIYIWIVNSGGGLATVAAGYVTLSQGWRWVWWWMAIFFGLALLLFVFMYDETKYTYPAHSIEGIPVSGDQAPPPVEQKCSDVENEEKATVGATTSKKPKSGGNDGETTIRNFALNPNIPRKTYLQRLAFITHSPRSMSSLFLHSWQSGQILFTIPAVFYMSLVYGLMMSWFSIIITTLSTYMVLPPYDFDSAQIGLVSIASFIGITIGTIVCGPFADRLILWLARKNNGIYEPEMRLWVMVPFIPFIPAGALMFGIGLANGVHWLVVAAGFTILSIGGGPICSISLTYITDSYAEIVGSALVGLTFIRNIFATVCVFTIAPWIAASGMVTVYIVIGVLGTALLLFTFFFIYYGKRLRVRTAKRYRHYAARQYNSREV